MNCESFFLTGEEVRTEPYRYRACGLDGIYLLNGYDVAEHDGEKHVSVTDIEGLHRAIGRHLVVNRKGLAPKEIRFLRNTMDLTQAQLAEMLGNTSQSVARWEKGECEMPGTSEKLLRAVFLATLMSDSELSALRDFLTRRLNELDQLDELTAPDAEFEFDAHWAERPALKNAA
ncbi:MAG: transcriptional regulator [Sphingobium sp.]|nr:transcriptional regulator [Sphingobium sp.]